MYCRTCHFFVMLNFFKRTVFVIVFFIVPFKNINATEKGGINRISPQFLSDTSKWVDSVFNSLTIEERIAQLIVAPAYPNKDLSNYIQLVETVKKYNVGGIIFFNGGPAKTVNYINELQCFAKTPLLMGIDGEWGLSMRMDSTLVYPKQIMLGALTDDSLIYQMACDIAWQLKRLGFQTNFSPVVDINNNPCNPIINSRSFGENKNRVISKGYSYMAGLQDNHILSFAKHFPGHGATETDSHLSLPLIPYNRSRLDTLELYPFKYLINKGVSGVMVAHLDIPALDSTNMPASLSSKIVNNLLIDTLGFKGLVITDALSMKALSNSGTQSGIALQCIKAGIDILLMPDDIPDVIETIKNSISSGIISLNDINRKCRKVLLAKYWTGLGHFEPVEPKNLIDDLHKPAFELTRRKLIESSLTVIRNENNILPLTRLDTLRVACISIGLSGKSALQQTLELYGPVDAYSIGRDVPDSIYNQLLNSLKKYNLVIAGLFSPDMRAIYKFGITDKSVNFVNKLASHVPVVLDLFANPYSLERFTPSEKFKAIIVSYENGDLNQELSAQLIYGGITPKGKLPVKGSEEYLAGTGITWDNLIRIKYTIPEELGIDSKKLQPIDSLVNDAINKKAIPGCVVYFAKDDKVFYNKAFGYTRYDKTSAVKTTDIYDLASVTKVSATIPALMTLYDRKKIELSERLSKYLPVLNKTNKKKITINEILAHQARLQAWIPFYVKTVQCANQKESFVSSKPGSAGSYKVNNTTFINCKTEYRDSIYSKTYSDEYPYQVADSLFIRETWRDSIYNYIYKSELLSKSKYLYSDLGFMLLYRAVENITGKKFDHYLDNTIYKPLGAATLCFNPLKKFDRKNIAPTENDKIFRKQLVWGYVHDPGAAMLGGVCGHAGLFANANDLGKLMQLYLNKGIYGGKRYFNESTVDLFTSRPFEKTGNSRALGFEKLPLNPNWPSAASKMASDLSFGHTGFTGTMVWVDPKFGLVYIFLSNRVYPDASSNKLVETNLRANIQDVVYNALISKASNSQPK